MGIACEPIQTSLVRLSTMACERFSRRYSVDVTN
ncbi:hypothetical protein Pint_05349 [Pistacia integerrima]|uniref:Uncharacterized protein n=1 Tax=Pistacia integerrima TaxID=434235 RepID=A0ACC0Z399_9ROSI|nr:hypothetical protein Pint_05349 [Pistacia integerrima]